MDIKPELCNFNGVGPIKYIRDFPPAHFTLEIHSFSSLSNSQEQKYESDEFESGGYNWRLFIYPTGDKTRNGAGYISLYLSISDTSMLPLGWEVLVNYKLFVFDQLRDKYLTVHDNSGGIRRFNNIKKEWGFAQLISLDTFNQASNGYLVSDSCIFGAEVFVIKYSGKRGCLPSMVKEPDNRTYTWKVSHFSSLPDRMHCSDVFKVGNFGWTLKLYSKGFRSGKNTHLSLYLELLDLHSLPLNRKLYAEFAVRVRDQVNGLHYERKFEHMFDSLEQDCGFPKFLLLDDLNNAAKGYLINDTIIFEVEFLAMPRFQLAQRGMHRNSCNDRMGEVSDEEQAKQGQLTAILHTLTPLNVESLVRQVAVYIDNAVTLNGLVSQIFEKALTNSHFCEMHADLCYHFAHELPDFSANNEKITFKRLLLNKFQEEFESGEREQEEASMVEEGKESKEKREEKRIQAQRRMLRNIRFIGELYKKKMLTGKIMHSCINKWLGQNQNPNEDDIESLCILMCRIGEMIDHPIAKDHMDTYFDKMDNLSTNMKLSSRVRLMLKDTIDLRRNKWQQKRS